MVELVVKVLDARSSNGHHRVYCGALSNVEFTVNVTDTAIWAGRRSDNAMGRFASVGHITAFPSP
jgi:hypothetical protein